MRTSTWLLAALALPVLLGARPMERQGLPPGREEAVDEVGPENAAGFVRGRVLEVDRAAGRVALDSAGQRVTLNGRPDDLAELAPGREVSLPFENYGGNLWLAPGDAPVGGPPSRTVEGRITAIDKNQGRVAVDGTPYFAHPADLAPLAPGQVVRFGAVELDGRSWWTGRAPRPTGTEAGGERRAP